MKFVCKNSKAHVFKLITMPMLAFLKSQAILRGVFTVVLRIHYVAPDEHNVSVTNE